VSIYGSGSIYGMRGLFKAVGSISGMHGLFMAVGSICGIHGIFMACVVSLMVTAFTFYTESDGNRLLGHW
jgi:hypothetical protein